MVEEEKEEEEEDGRFINQIRDHQLDSFIRKRGKAGRWRRPSARRSRKMMDGPTPEYYHGR